LLFERTAFFELIFAMVPPLAGVDPVSKDAPGRLGVSSVVTLARVYLRPLESLAF
jgi:hypothetical protein